MKVNGEIIKNIYSLHFIQLTKQRQKEISDKVAEKIKNTFHNINDLLANIHKLKPQEEEAPNSIIKKLPSIKSELEVTSPTPIKKSVSFKETEENKHSQPVETAKTPTRNNSGIIRESKTNKLDTFLISTDEVKISDSSD